MATQQILLPVASFGAGVAAHLLFFHQGEKGLHPMRYVQFYFLLIAITTVASSHYLHLPTYFAFKTSLKLFWIHLLGLYSSLITYRLFFNPLNSIPGPFFARLSKFDTCVRNRAFDGHHQLKSLHDKYNSKFIRIGPNDLSVTHVDAVNIISAPNSKCTKAQWYSNDAPLTSMHTTRDRATHDRRRRVWAPAFSDKALRGYEARVKTYNDLLVTSITASLNKPLNMSEVFNHYSFDVMGDLAFGHSFQMLESGKEHWAIKLLNEGMDPLGFGFPTWFFRTLTAIPGAAKGYWDFIGFCTQQLENRMNEQTAKSKGNEDRDIIHTLIDQYNSLDASSKKTALPMLQGDSRLIIVAGSDTTAATLVHLWYHIASDPSIQSKLRAEIEGLVGKNAISIDHNKIQDAEYLNGCLYEALRLHPPVPSGVFRKTPKEGINVAGTFIAGDTTIQMPQYVMSLDEDNYTRPTEFLPERWSSSNIDKMVKHKDAWQPFSSGPFGCIGKNLALMEVRLVTAELLLKFNVKLANGEDGHELLMKTRDHFTLGLGKCDMLWEARK